MASLLVAGFQVRVGEFILIRKPAKTTGTAPEQNQRFWLASGEQRVWNQGQFQTADLHGLRDVKQLSVQALALEMKLQSDHGMFAVNISSWLQELKLSSMTEK